MKFGAIFAALTLGISAASFSALAQTQGGPPNPRPAAGALPQPNPNAVNRSFRTQTKEEQQQTTNTSNTPMDVGQSGRTRSAN